MSFKFTEEIDKLNTKIKNWQWYQFMDKHKRVINVLEGLVVIFLLFNIWMYLDGDRELKEQIADHCGYENNEYTCVCDKNFVENYQKSMHQNIVFNEINTSKINEYFNSSND